VQCGCLKKYLTKDALISTSLSKDRIVVLLIIFLIEALGIHVLRMGIFIEVRLPCSTGSHILISSDQFMTYETTRRWRLIFYQQWEIIFPSCIMAIFRLCFFACSILRVSNVCNAAVFRNKEIKASFCYWLFSCSWIVFCLLCSCIIMG
jgi:hypothetical protein